MPRNTEPPVFHTRHWMVLGICYAIAIWMLITLVGVIDSMYDEYADAIRKEIFDLEKQLEACQDSCRDLSI